LSKLLSNLWVAKSKSLDFPNLEPGAI
jgi:hypothetical protein